MIDISEAIKEALQIIPNKEERMAKIQGVLDLSHKKILNEINHRLSTAPICINIDADDELDKGNDVFVRNNGKLSLFTQIRERSSSISYDVLTQGVKDNIGESFVLKFGRKEEDRTVSDVTFTFDKVLVLTNDRFVIEGFCRMSRSPVSISRKKPTKIQIDYQWKEQKFYEAVYCANGTIRHKKELKLNSAGVYGEMNVKIATDLIQFMTLCLYSIEDYITEVNNK